MDAYEAIMTRRSWPRAEGPAPDRATILDLLRAATRAPNHRLTEPWRFVVLAGDALDELAEAWAADAAARGKDPDEARAKAHRAPVIVVVIERPKTHLRKVHEIEEHHAVGAAMQNLLLAAHARGLAASLRTGPPVHIPAVRALLGCGDDELIAGLIYLGHRPPGDDRPPTRRTPPEELTEFRGL